MNANQMITALEWAEVNPKYEADTRQMMRDERFALIAAARSGDPVAIKAAMTEARRVAAMWGVKLS